MRPCDHCGEDYVFLIDEDPGECPDCHRATGQLYEMELTGNRIKKERKP